MARKRFPAAHTKEEYVPARGSTAVHKALECPPALDSWVSRPVGDEAERWRGSRENAICKFSAGMRPRRSSPADTKYEGPADNSRFTKRSIAPATARMARSRPQVQLGAPPYRRCAVPCLLSILPARQRRAS